MPLVRVVEKLLLCATSTAVAASLVLFPAAAIAQTPASLAVNVRDEGVVNVTNATAGGSVVLFMCERGSRNGRTHVRKRALIVRDDDGDGSVQFTADSKIALRSVWIAVDLSSGATGAGAPSTFPLVVTEIPVSKFKRDAEGAVAELEQDLRRLILLLVRPGSGAWTLAGRDGEAGDGDRIENARVTLTFADARPVEGEAAAPKHLKKGDVLVAIDQSRLDVYFARIASAN